MTTQQILLDRPPAGGASATAGEDAPAVVDLEIVVPVLNEEHRLPATLDELVAYLPTLPLSSHVIVVDNGSVDATDEVVDRFASDGVPVDVVGCRTPGKGAAVRAGMARTTARWVGYCDADLSTPIPTIAEALHQLDRGFHVVMASRRCTGASYLVDQPARRRAASRLFHVATRPLVGRVADTQCGFKFFHGPTARELFRACELNGFTFDVEVVARAQRAGLRMIEVPVAWTHCEGSTLGIARESVRVAREVVDVHRALRQARPRP